MNTTRNPSSIHAISGRYVHQIEVTDPKRILFISGQVGMRLDQSVPEDPTEQFEVAVENVIRNLEAAGLGVTALTKITTYAVGPLDAAARRAVLDRLLGAHVTTSTLVHVAGLAAPEYKVEVDAWAAE